MKRITFLLLMITATGILFACSNKSQNGIYGKYEFDKLIYNSLLSSSTPEYVESHMKGTEYIINEGSFEIISPDSDYKIDKPTYEKEKLTDDFIQSMNNIDKVSISDYKEKYRYSIYAADEKINYYLYSLDDELWIGGYADNTANSTDIIMYLYKLKSAL